MCYETLCATIFQWLTRLISSNRKDPIGFGHLHVGDTLAIATTS